MIARTNLVTEFRRCGAKQKLTYIRALPSSPTPADWDDHPTVLPFQFCACTFDYFKVTLVSDAFENNILIFHSNFYF